VDVETSRECVQESFLKLHEHLIAGGDRSNLRAWLYRVAHNLARNAQASAAAKRTEPLPETSGVSDPVATEASAEESLLARERERVLKEALEQLSPAQRECLVLRSQGFKYREIAELLALSVSTVGENIQRGLTKLKDLL
jgi:RNA polymerase sigma-70 factor (ECF subfamily)